MVAREGQAVDEQEAQWMSKDTVGEKEAQRMRTRHSGQGEGTEDEKEAKWLRRRHSG